MGEVQQTSKAIEALTLSERAQAQLRDMKHRMDTDVADEMEELLNRLEGSYGYTAPGALAECVAELEAGNVRLREGVEVLLESRDRSRASIGAFRNVLMPLLAPDADGVGESASSAPNNRGLAALAAAEIVALRVEVARLRHNATEAEPLMRRLQAEVERLQDADKEESDAANRYTTDCDDAVARLAEAHQRARDDAHER